jgi:NAD(P) transhydrogenase subunit alpha
VSLIGVVAEQEAESRVAATPETVKVIRSLGYEVVVEKGAGAKASFPDSAYEAA